MKTFTAKPADISHDWHLVDAAGVPLGRLASVIAQLIRGKHKPTYTPHMDGGDFVVVVNASKVRLTGRKLTNKVYFGHTGYMGHERRPATFWPSIRSGSLRRPFMACCRRRRSPSKSSAGSSRCTPMRSIRTPRSSPSRFPSLRRR